MDKTKSIQLLDSAKNYEEKIVRDIGEYLLSIIPSIEDLSDEEKQRLNKTLIEISDDSHKHKHMFQELVQYVLDNENSQY